MTRSCSASCRTSTATLRNNLYADVVFPAQTWGEWPGGVYIQSERRAVRERRRRPVLRREGQRHHRGASRHGHGHRQGEARRREARPRCRPHHPLRAPHGGAVRRLLRPRGGLRGHREGQQGLGRRPHRNARGEGEGRGRPLRAAPPPARHPVARRDLRDRQGGRHAAPVHGPGGLGREALRAVPEAGRQGQVQALRAGLRRGRRADQGGHRRVLEVRREGRRGALALQEPGAPGEGARQRADARAPGPRALPRRGQDARGRREGGTSTRSGSALGIVYEHFHSAKTIRGPSTLRLVPEQYVEVAQEDADRYGLEDGEKVRVVTRRGSYEGRVAVRHRVDGAAGALGVPAPATSSARGTCPSPTARIPRRTGGSSTACRTGPGTPCRARRTTRSARPGSRGSRDR